MTKNGYLASLLQAFKAGRLVPYAQKARLHNDERLHGQTPWRYVASEHGSRISPDPEHSPWTTEKKNTVCLPVSVSDHDSDIRLGRRREDRPVKCRMNK